MPKPLKKDGLDILDFFRDDDGRSSMSRLMMLLSFIPATFVLWLRPTDTIFMSYIGAYVAGYVGGKFGDRQ